MAFALKMMNGNVSFGSSGMSSSSSSSAKSIVNKYKNGKIVDVYYNPSDPYKSVLEPGTTWKSYAIYVGGLLFLICGVLVLGGSVLKILLGGAIIMGAVGGLIGKKKQDSRNLSKYPPPQTQQPNQVKNKPQNKPQNKPNNSNDDGIDIT